MQENGKHKNLTDAVNLFMEYTNTVPTGKESFECILMIARFLDGSPERKPMILKSDRLSDEDVSKLVDMTI